MQILVETRERLSTRVTLNVFLPLAYDRDEINLLQADNSLSLLLISLQETHDCLFFFNVKEGEYTTEIIC